MPFYLSIAFKNIFRDRRRSFTLGINYFFIALLLLMVFSITQGIKKNVTDSIIASTAGHITVSGQYIVNGRTYQGIKEYPRIDSVIKANFSDARIITRYTLSSSVYYKNVSKRLSFTGMITDSDDRLKDQVAVKPALWDKFKKQPNGVLMPQSIAGYFGLAERDELLIATRSRFGAFNTGTIAVSAIFTTGNYFLRETIIGHFDFMQSLDLADSVTTSKMYIFFDDIRDAAANRDLLLEKLSVAGFITNKPANNNDALNAVSAASPRYKVEDENLNQIRLTLSTADEVTGIVSQIIGAINGIGLFIAAIMLFIISISIFINMRMTINDRMQEIGTLRAMGSEQNDIIKLFVSENFFLALLFSIGGLIAGLILMGLGTIFITLPADGTIGLLLNRGHPVFQPTAGAMIFIVAILMFFTTLFSYFPARYGGRIPPVVALSRSN